MIDKDEKIFGQFLNWFPHFAGSPVRDWQHQGTMSPDIICSTREGDRIGLELTEWVDHDYFRTANKWQTLLKSAAAFRNWAITISIKTYEYTQRDKDLLKGEFVALIQEKVRSAEA